MSLPLSFHPAVRGELDDAYRWYEARQTGLVRAFRDEAEAGSSPTRPVSDSHTETFGKDCSRAFPTPSITEYSPTEYESCQSSTRLATRRSGNPAPDGSTRQKASPHASRSRHRHVAQR